MDLMILVLREGLSNHKLPTGEPNNTLDYLKKQQCTCIELQFHIALMTEIKERHSYVQIYSYDTMVINSQLLLMNCMIFA